MILRLSQKLNTKIKAGKLTEMPLGRKSVCGLVMPLVHSGSNPVHHHEQHEVALLVRDVRCWRH